MFWLEWSLMGDSPKTSHNTNGYNSQKCWPQTPQKDACCQRLLPALILLPTTGRLLPHTFTLYFFNQFTFVGNPTLQWLHWFFLKTSHLPIFYYPFLLWCETHQKSSLWCVLYVRSFTHCFGFEVSICAVFLKYTTILKPFYYTFLFVCMFLLPSMIMDGLTFDFSAGHNTFSSEPEITLQSGQCWQHQLLSAYKTSQICNQST